ncbi:MAG: class I SAM-dependent methyltransferase [Proteobacteria bacterium]|nr:class I SAM-dependent methyltransferase [Pseudomonadota bacterium]
MRRPMSGNQEQIEYWNGITAERWVQNQELIDQAIQPFGDAALERLELRPGQHVLDVGCGSGTCSVRLAARVGPDGSVLGMDISAPMLEHARNRAQTVKNLSFTEADASEHSFTPNYDAAYSRFGVMFFADPTAAFANLRTALKPSARLAFVCWREAEHNPWCLTPMAAVVKLLPEPPPEPEPDAPGPFALADRARLDDVLRSAGFDRVLIEALDLDVRLSETGLEGAVDFAMRVGPPAGLLAEAPEDVVSRARVEIERALEPFVHDQSVALPGAAWVVSARVG